MPKFRLPWSKTAEERARDREDEIEISLSERLRGNWARFHEGLPWRRVDEEPERDLEEPVKPGRWKWWAAIGAVLVVGLAAAIFLVAPKINRRLEDRSLRQAREYLRVQDYQRAQLTLEQAVQVNPADLEARRELAQFYEEAGSPRALDAWQDLMALDPANDRDRLALARCALTFEDLPLMQDALSGVSPAGRATVRYHQLMAGVALKKNDRPALAREIAEIARLDPGDARARFNQAVISRQSPDPAQRAAAQSELETLARGKDLRIRATLELIAWEIRQHSRTAYTRLADLILPPRHGAFFLTGVGDAPRGLLDLVQQMESQPDPTPEDAAQLGEWLVRQGYPADAVVWLATLKPEVQTDRAVLAAQALALARIHDWPGMQQALRAGAWGKISDDVLTLAFAAHVQHDRARADRAASTWSDAVDLAGNAPALRVLLRLSGEFGWPDESIRVLQQLTQVTPRDTANWRSLAASVSALRSTSELAEVYSAWTKAIPTDPIAHGQYRWVETLLGHGPPNDPDPTELSFPAISAARALELDETGRPAAALAVLSREPAGAATDWRVALARGFTLAELGRPAESERSLAIAAANPLLTEEKALLDRAHAANSGASPAR